MISEILVTLNAVPTSDALPWFKEWGSAIVGLAGALVGALASFGGVWLQQRAEHKRAQLAWKRTGFQQLVSELIRLRDDVENCKHAITGASVDSPASYFARVNQQLSAYEQSVDVNSAGGQVSWRWPWNNTLEVMAELYIPAQSETLQKLKSEVRLVNTKLSEIRNCVLGSQMAGDHPQHEASYVFNSLDVWKNEGCQSADSAFNLIEQLFSHLRGELNT
jgi:hypothetical protein